MKINHGLDKDFDAVIWSMKSRKDASLVKKLWARVQQVLSIYESMLDSKVSAAIDEAKEGETEKETDGEVETNTDASEEKEIDQ